MMKVLNFLNKLEQTLLSIAKVLIASNWPKSIPSLNSSSVLILGNGPSAQKTLDEISERPVNMPTMCLNHFASSSDFEKVRPAWYILLDPGFADPKHALGMNLINNLSMQTDWPLNLLIPEGFKKSGVFMGLFANHEYIRLYHFNDTIIKGFRGFENFCYTQGLGLPQSQNVLVAAVFQGVKMGCKTVYISGADHSWHENLRVSDENNTLILNDEHFYGKRKRDLSVEFGNMHFRQSELAKQFLSLYKVFSGHERVSRFAESMGAKVINISSHSNIDVYQRGKLPIES